MSTLNRLIVSAVILVGPSTLMGASSQDVSPETKQQVQQVFKSLQDAYGQRNVEAVMALVDSAFAEPPRDILKQALEAEFAQDKSEAKQWHVLGTTGHEQTLAVRVAETTQPGSGSDDPKTTNKLFVLRPHNGSLLIAAMYTEADPNQFDRQAGIYTSRKGRFSLAVPAGWTPVGSALLNSMVADSLTLMAPDLESKVMMGVVQLPLKLADDEAGTAQKGAQTDVAMEKQMTLEHRVCDQGPTTVAGKGAYRVVTEFTAKETPDVKRKRMRVYVSDHPMLYFFLCDAMGPESFGTLRPQFDAIVASFRLLPGEAGISRQETLAAEQAKGAVTGRVYTSQEFNCFIAAPEGWEIRTSPNPAHLVEMQYTKGKSIARLIAAKGVSADKLEQVVDKRIDTVRGIVLDFSESGRNKVTLGGTPGIESIQTYRIQELGTFHVKEVTYVRDNTYYLILCQCIEPDDYATLEPDFDRIIQSFGFTQ